MPLNNYSVLKGRPIDNRLATGASPHYQVLISDDGVLHRIAINVRSQDGSEVEYLVRSHFEHPIIEGLAELSEGLHEIPSKPGGLALDFIRGNIALPSEFQPLPLSATGPDNDLNEKLDTLVQRAMADEDAMVYAFGDTWGPEKKADRYFGFKPGRGIHDIHFNQGNPPGRFAESNGPWQDGGLIFEFPRQQQWSAIFLKFQTQEWHSDDATGGTIDPPIEVADGLVRIIAAYVNDVRTPERETVTLLNTANVAVGLNGWVIMDKQKNRMVLDGSIEAGGTRLIQITQPVSLSNKGGIITLLNDKGLKIHGVSYTKDQAREPGRTIPFQV
jgi:uncharacterized protein YukJ